MKKINNHIIVFTLRIVCLGLLCSQAYAKEEASSFQTIFNTKELVSLFADNAKQEVFDHTDWNDRNPFDTSPIEKKAGHEAEEGAPQVKYVLEGLFLGTSRPSAIIDGKVVVIGDEIKGATVNVIKDNTVILTDNQGQQIVLQLNQ